MMTFASELPPMTPEQRASYGIARAKTIAFTAVHDLWRRRKAEGKSQAELATVLNKDEGWLSKNLRGPGNWTIKTLGELVEALDGEIEIIVHRIEDSVWDHSNDHAYAGYEAEIPLKDGSGTIKADKESRSKMRVEPETRSSPLSVSVVLEHA
jgi:transcriptional regulator with XRE-family HTH domain